MRENVMSLTCRLAIAAIFVLCAPPEFAQAQQRPVVNEASVRELANEPQGFVAEPEPLRRAAIFADRHLSGGELSSGFYAELNLIPGSGWIGAGPGYRHWFKKDRAFFDSSAAISWHAYKTAQARFELPKLVHSRLLLGSQVRWQDFTQVSFYGEGPLAVLGNHTEYRLRSTDIVGYATVRPWRWVGITGSVGWLSPSVLPRAGTFMRNRPDARQLFAGNPVFAVADQPSYMHRELAAAVDTRDFPGHTTKGALLRGAASEYSDRDRGLFSFRRYEAEGAGFVPIAGSRIVLAMHGWIVTSATDAGQFVPFYLQPNLGGNNSVRAYPNYRFHDGHLLLLTVEPRFALTTHLDAAFLFDAGNVAARIGDLDLGRRSYGAGLRVHTRRVTFARFDVAHGTEGWRMMFSLSDPLTLSRTSRHTASAPFVP
jgi:hypothetical protein